MLDQVCCSFVKSVTPGCVTCLLNTGKIKLPGTLTATQYRIAPDCIALRYESGF